MDDNPEKIPTIRGVSALEQQFELPMIIFSSKKLIELLIRCNPQFWKQPELTRRDCQYSLVSETHASNKLRTKMLCKGGIQYMLLRRMTGLDSMNGYDPLRLSMRVLSQGHRFNNLCCFSTLAQHVVPVFSVNFISVNRQIMLVSGISNGTLNFWQLSLDNMSATLVETLAGHGNCSFAWAVHTMEPVIAARRSDNRVNIWHVSGNSPANCVKTVGGHHDTVSAIAFDSTRSLFATGYTDGSVALWNGSANGLPATRVATLNAHDGFVSSVVFHKSAALMATSSITEPTVKLWNILPNNTGATQVAVIDRHYGGVTSIAFHPTMPLLATSSHDNTIKLWLISSENSSATCVATLAGHSKSVSSVEFHPTAPLLVSCGEDSIKLWRLSSNNTYATCVSTLEGHSGYVLSVAFHPTAPLLATGSWDKTVRLWR
jgi:WD40 repeat protein